MIMKAVDGREIVHPLHYGDGTGGPRGLWTAAGVAVLLHAAGLAWLYGQGMSGSGPVEISDPPRPTIVSLEPWKRAEPAPTPPPVTAVRPHKTTPLVEPPSTLDIAPSEITPAGEGPPVALQDPPIELGPITGSGPGTALAPPVIVNPKWLSRPSPEQMARYYPTGALEDGVQGRVVLSCRVTVKGTLEACAPVSETPAGQGFGEAALKVSRFFRMSPQMVDGRPVDGASVKVALSFAIDE